MKTVLRSAGIALLATMVCVPIAGAATTKCQRAIAKASAQYQQARAKALSKCNEGVVKAGSGSCPDPKTAEKVGKALTKMTASIGKACGGDDKVCGGNLTNEDSPASLGWPATCPNFEKGGNCTNAITDCNGIATCIACVDDAAIDQSLALSFGAIDLQTADKALNKCQVTIGKANTAFFNAVVKAKQKCWDARINGKHTNDCFPPSQGDGKYQAAIQKARAKQLATICKACGGANKACGGGDDFTPAQIGFASECTYVTRPHDLEDCSSYGPIATLQNIVDCTACANHFKADCTDDLSVGPAYATYQPECTACTIAPASGPCPTAISFTADGDNTDLETGFTGLAHNQTIPSNSQLTLAVSDCAGGSEPNCGLCNVSGPLDNVGGPESETHRCNDAPWKTCDVDADCTSAMQCVGGTNNGGLCTTGSECPGGSCVNAGFTGPCVYFFGPPLPLRPPGGPSTCVLNRIAAPISGTVDFSDGSTQSLVPLASRVHVFGDDFEPCPHCREDGKCNSGPRAEQACVVSGTSQRFGTVSLDCPPSNEVATLFINLNISTGGQTKTVEAGNPNCRDTGYGSLKCICDTCNNLNQEGCSVNADCPDSGGGAGICGGKRCIGGTEAGQPCGTCIGGTDHGSNCNFDSQCTGGGTCANPRTCVGGANDGANCSTTSMCPGGTCPQNECASGGSCTRPGEATKPNACVDDTLTPESGCVPIPGTDNEAACADAPVEQVCSIQQFLSCSTDADCTSCPDCVPGQTCLSRHRPCFTDEGVIGNTVTVTGSPDPVCGGVSKPTVGTFFCVAPTGSTAVNSAGGLPGLGRARIPGTVVVNP
jgi:hypothetical protein